MTIRFRSPSEYVQGEQELARLGRYVQAFGSKALLIASSEDRERVQSILDATVEQHKVEFVYGNLQGGCTRSVVNELSTLSAAKQCAVVIGLGGGRALDTAKAVGYTLQLPIIIVPTSASTDAPCSSIAVVYHDNGELDTYLQLTRNPELILVDTAIIAKAPVRLLVAGMGDALSTYYEARACMRSQATGRFNQTSSQAAFSLAVHCRQVLRSYSVQAKADCEKQLVSPALANIVEANILLSGLAFEGCGLAAAHAIHNGLTTLDSARGKMHGELVAFGVLVQLVLEEEQADIEEVLAYNKALGLPVCLADLGVDKQNRDELMKAAQAACVSSSPIHHMPFTVTPDQIINAMLKADRIGSTF